MSRPAIAYNDYIRTGTLDVASTLLPIDGLLGLGRLPEPQLSQCAVFSGDFGSTPSFWTLSSAPYFGWSLSGEVVSGHDGQYVSCVSLLDVRVISGNVRIVVAAHMSDASSADELVVLAEASLGYGFDYPDGFIRHFHYLSGIPTGPSSIHVDGIYVLASGVGEFSIGRVWASPLYTPSYEIKMNWSMSIPDIGSTLISDGGQGYPKYLAKIRELQMEFNALPLSEIIGGYGFTGMDLQQLVYIVGTTDQVITFPRTTYILAGVELQDLQAIHRLGIYGYCPSTPPIRHVNADFFDSNWTVRELL